MTADPAPQDAALSLRDQFAAHAPISYDVAAHIYGEDLPSDDRGRAAFFAVWSLLCFEWADAMLAERSGS